MREKNVKICLRLTKRIIIYKKRILTDLTTFTECFKLNKMQIDEKLAVLTKKAFKNIEKNVKFS